MTRNTKYNRPGRPPGIPREGKYGTGVQTKVVRVPIEVADHLPEILQTFDSIKTLVDSWEVKLEEAAQQSVNGKPSPRYEQAVNLLQELRLYLGS